MSGEQSNNTQDLFACRENSAALLGEGLTRVDTDGVDWVNFLLCHISIKALSLDFADRTNCISLRKVRSDFPSSSSFTPPLKRKASTSILEVLLTSHYIRDSSLDNDRYPARLSIHGLNPRLSSIMAFEKWYYPSSIYEGWLSSPPSQRYWACLAS